MCCCLVSVLETHQRFFLSPYFTLLPQCSLASVSWKQARSNWCFNTVCGMVAQFVVNYCCWQSGLHFLQWPLINYSSRLFLALLLQAHDAVASQLQRLLPCRRWWNHEWESPSLLLRQSSYSFKIWNLVVVVIVTVPDMIYTLENMHVVQFYTWWQITCNNFVVSFYTVYVCTFMTSSV